MECEGKLRGRGHCRGDHKGLLMKHAASKDGSWCEQREVEFCERHLDPFLDAVYALLLTLILRGGKVCSRCGGKVESPDDVYVVH